MDEHGLALHVQAVGMGFVQRAVGQCAHLPFVIDGLAEIIERPLRQGLRAVDPAARAQHAGGFRHGGIHVLGRNVVETVEVHHDVHGPRQNRQGLRHAIDDRHAVHWLGGSRLFELAGAAFDADHTGRARASHGAGQSSVAASHIDDGAIFQLQGLEENVAAVFVIHGFTRLSKDGEARPGGFDARPA